MSQYTRYPSNSGGGVTAVGSVGSTPTAAGASITGSTLTLQPADATHPGVLTAVAQAIAGAKTFSAAIISSVASGSQAIELVQGARVSFDSGTGAKYISSDGTYVVAVGLGFNSPAATGYAFTGVGVLTASGGAIVASGLSVNAQQFVSTGVSGAAKFTGNTTQTTATKPAIALFGLASNQASQIGADIGVGTAWSGLNTQKIARFGYGIDATGAGTFPHYIMGTGKLGFFNSTSNAADVVGTATLVGGTVTVQTTAVDTGDFIFISLNTPGGTLGSISAPVASIVASTAFVINSSSAVDTSTVNWWIVKKG